MKKAIHRVERGERCECKARHAAERGCSSERSNRNVLGPSTHRSGGWVGMVLATDCVSSQIHLWSISDRGGPSLDARRGRIRGWTQYSLRGLTSVWRRSCRPSCLCALSVACVAAPLSFERILGDDAVHGCTAFIHQGCGPRNAVANTDSSETARQTFLETSWGLRASPSS